MLREKWLSFSLDGLLMSRALHRLGPPALLPLRHVILEIQEKHIWMAREGHGDEDSKRKWRKDKVCVVYLKVGVRLPVVPSVVLLRNLNGLSCWCPPHLQSYTHWKTRTYILYTDGGIRCSEAKESCEIVDVVFRSLTAAFYYLFNPLLPGFKMAVCA